MLEINLKEPISIIKPVLTPIVKIENPNYKLMLYSDGHRKKYCIGLPSDVSGKKRYSEFHINTENLQDIEKGEYIYHIYQYETLFTEVEWNIVKTGSLRVVGNCVDNKIIWDIPESEFDDLIYYDPLEVETKKVYYLKLPIVKQ